MVTVTLTIGTDVAPAADKLAAVEARARAPFPGSAGAVMYAFRKVLREAFASEGATTAASAWAPLAPATEKDRARKGFPRSHPILERTAQLRRALTVGDGADVRTTPTKLEYVLTSDAPSVQSFKYHQSRAPRRKLPRRAIVSLTEPQRARIVEPIRRYILTGVADVER